jgi:glycosyltransferase involved in cell wall biosynthesis
MRVLYVHHRPEGGGAPTSLALLIEALGDRVEPVVVCPGGPAAARFHEAGARVIEAPVAGFNHNWTGTYRGSRAALLARDVAGIPAHLLSLRRAIEQFRPELVHLNELSLLPAARVASRRGLPLVWHVRAALPDDDLPDTRLVRRAVADRASVSIAINEDVAATYGWPSNMQIVPNPVAIPPSASKDTAAAKRSLGLRPDSTAVGMLSKLYDKKGWRDLLEAVATARRGGADLEVLLAGGAVRSSAWFQTARGQIVARVAGLEDTELELARAVDRLGLQDAVHTLDFHSDVASVYAALDIVCAPSRGPEVGRPIMEGQAHGLAVVATGAGSGGGIVNHDRDGLVVPRGDERALVSALVRLADDAALRERLGAEARRKAERDYSHVAVADRVLALYEVALCGGRGTAH